MRVIGARVQIEKEKLDSGGFNLAYETDKDGQKNSGIVIGVGSWWMRLFGITEGKTIFFRKHFRTNADQPDEKVFVYYEDILAVND